MHQAEDVENWLMDRRNLLLGAIKKGPVIMPAQ
jgi:hypothetical protein